MTPAAAPIHDWQTMRVLCRLEGRCLVRRADNSAVWIITRPTLTTTATTEAAANTVRPFATRNTAWHAEDIPY
ncbi:hypothetical protein [Ferrovibrio sp.]|uniref:hypothetical protein n=1 Tax=Ferrovibrio sp. TaxID=1917215 RepID=UPI003D1534BA